MSLKRKMQNKKEARVENYEMLINLPSEKKLLKRLWVGEEE